MRISYGITIVLLDGEWHSEPDIIDRVRPLLNPAWCVRRYAQCIDNTRTSARRRHNNRTGKELLAARKPNMMDQITDIDPNVAVAWYVRYSLKNCARSQNGRPPSFEQEVRKIQDSLDTTKYWRLTEAGRQHITGNKYVCNALALQIKKSLMRTGKLL